MVPRQDEKARVDLDEPWAIGGQHVVTPEGVRAAAVVIRGEKIELVTTRARLPAGCPFEDVGTCVLLPGLVDAHVHINEPGRTEWEGFQTATRAAAAGGITTLVDMPLNCAPVTTTVDALNRKLAAAERKLWVDCGFYGGVVPGNADHLGALAAAGVLGFKAFLCHSGIDDFPKVTEADLRAAMPRIAATGLPLLVHAELVDASGDVTYPPRSYVSYLASRPRHWEHDAIRLVLALAGEFGCPVHIVHLSLADALPLIRQARAGGVRLTVETCPHYLYFAAEEIPDGDPRFKCAPPIRERDNRARLRAALREGWIDTIGSDHSPAPPGLKHLDTGDLQRAWGGIASLQLMLPLVWTMAREWSDVDFGDLIKWLSGRPARLVGLDGRKGALAAGYDADLVVFHPDAEFTVTAASLYHRHKVTPYEGLRLHGRVERTYLRGHKVFDAGQFEKTPRGTPLLHRGAREHAAQASA
jgi:allantoinase